MPTAARVVAIIQARMSSTRLPGKVLKDLAGQPMLWHVANRVRKARSVDDVVVATSTEHADDPIADFCVRHGIGLFRGSEADVLDRYYWAAKESGAGVIVRITGDCPLIDPEVVERVLAALSSGEYDYVANTLRCTYPDGLDAEAFTFAALERSWHEAQKPSEREHVTPYMHGAGSFRVHNVENDVDLSRHRWTVDEPEDLGFVRGIFSRLAEQPDFRLRSVVELLGRDPQLAAASTGIVRNEGYYRTMYAQARAGAAPKLSLVRSQQLLERATRVIPGGAQTFSKGFRQYVQGACPVFLERGKGCRVWDVDGNEYIDYVQGLLPNILGYANEEVNRAVVDQVSQGHSFSLPHPLEIELAERLARLIPCAEMVRFAKNGSDATAGAVRAARAYTGQDHIACCGYHGWQDWFIGTTTRNAGVPGAVCALTHPFRYDDLPSLERVLDEHPGAVAAVIMEPVTFVEPQIGYLQQVKDLAHRHGALLIFDEICTGFHWGLGGAQRHFGVTPDLACFGKALGNGFPISCVVGRAEVMRIFEDIFFSFTFGGELASMAAAIAVLDVLERTPALAQMAACGRRLQDGFNVMAKEAGLVGRCNCIGQPTWSLLQFMDADGKDSLLARCLFQQEVVKRGILLLTTHNMTAAHDAASTERTLETYAGVLKTLAVWLDDPDPSRFLEGEMIRPVFKVR